MLAQVITQSYDTKGKHVHRPRKKRFRTFAPTFPMGRYVTQPLSINCSSFEEMRDFLKNCRYVSDQDQFNKKDYWMPPEDFEAKKQGDCDDFALWAWRQVMNMGYDARFVVGRAGKYGEGHAWVTIIDDGKTILVEPLAAWLCIKFPRLSTVRYKPQLSVSWDGSKLRYFEHEHRVFNPKLSDFTSLFFEWSIFWVVHRPRIIARYFKTYYLWLIYFLRKSLTAIKTA